MYHDIHTRHTLTLTCHNDHPLLVGCINCSFSMMLMMTRAKLKIQSALSLLIPKMVLFTVTNLITSSSKNQNKIHRGAFLFFKYLFKFVRFKSNILYLNTKNNINIKINYDMQSKYGAEKFSIYCFKYGNFFSPSTSFFKSQRIWPFNPPEEWNKLRFVVLYCN